MGKTTPHRQQRKAALREQILEAARALFVTRGYEAVTMREIADRIGYTATALYYHFPDKAALLRELCTRDFRALREYFERLGRISDPVRRISEAGRAYAQYGLEHPQHYAFMFMTPYPEPAPHEVDIRAGDPNQDAYAFLRQAVQEAVAARRFRPEYRDADQLAQILWAAMHGVVALHLNCRDSQWLSWRPTEQTAERLGEALLRGLLREPAAAAPPRAARPAQAARRRPRATSPTSKNSRKRL